MIESQGLAQWQFSDQFAQTYFLGWQFSRCISQRSSMALQHGFLYYASITIRCISGDSLWSNLVDWFWSWFHTCSLYLGYTLLTRPLCWEGTLRSLGSTPAYYLENPSSYSESSWVKLAFPEVDWSYFRVQFFSYLVVKALHLLVWILCRLINHTLSRFWL